VSSIPQAPAIRAASNSKKETSSARKRRPVGSCPRQTPRCGPAHTNRATTVSPSATSVTISMRMSGTDARNGAIQRRAAGAISGA
jgi:hypothetical protein